MNAPIVYPKLSPLELAQRWNALLGSPGLPERYELDEYGEVIETGLPRTAHQRIVSAFQRQIVQALGGEALPGVAVLTSIGVRIPDVVWQQSWSGVDPVSPRRSASKCSPKRTRGAS